MYTVSIPVSLSEHFSKEETCAELKRAGAHRIFLSVSRLSFDQGKNDAMLATLRELVPYFQSQGFETGIWFWTFWYNDIEESAEEYLMVTSSGEKRINETVFHNGQPHHTGYCCPANPEFVSHATSIIKALAEIRPDILMFDDDFRYGFISGHGGCFCDAHIRLCEEKLGRPLTREALVSEIYADKPNPTRTAWQEVLGQTLEDFAVSVRETVDRVDPSIRVALCSVMSLWDIDGTDPIKIVKLLAGNTRPLMRLIGAPYWEVIWSAIGTYKPRLQNAIELERMQWQWCQAEDIEIMTEGDVCPRPRYNVPAAYLEIFDTALRAAGVGHGIHKYMLDYGFSARYETGYIDRHLKNTPVYADVERIFGDKASCGVRVYETMKKFCDADLTGIADREAYSETMFFSRAAKMLSDDTIPITYCGNKGVGIAFGENARCLPSEAFENGLILDIRAARILMEQGIDVGIDSIGDQLSNDSLYYVWEKEYLPYRYRGESAYQLTLKPEAQTITEALCGQMRYPDTFLYENKNRQRFLVFAFDAHLTDESRHVNYCTENQLCAAIEWVARHSLPVKCPGHPRLYMLCKQNDSGMAIGLWNIFADEVICPAITLDREYTHAEFINCNGTLQGNTVTLDEIAPFGFVLIALQ